VRFATARDPTIKLILSELGKKKNATNEKVQRVLIWAPRSSEEAVEATAKTLMRLALFRGSTKKNRVKVGVASPGQVQTQIRERWAG
jgi:hypothetical protein